MLFLETEWDLDRKGDFARKVTFYLNSLDNCLIFSSPLRRHGAGQTCPGNGLWRGTTVKCLSEGAFGDESLSKIILIETEPTKLCEPKGYTWTSTACRAQAHAEEPKFSPWLVVRNLNEIQSVSPSCWVLEAQAFWGLVLWTHCQSAMGDLSARVDGQSGS